MKKVLTFILMALAITAVFVSCDPESGTVNDVTFNVSVNLKNVGEDKKESVAYVGDVTWKYTAIKGDDAYTTGETTEEKELGDGNLGKLSLGTWTITLFGYEDGNVTYTGSVNTGSIVADTTVAVSVEKISKDAKVKFYSDFAAAVTAATAGDTITLVKDVEVKESVTLDKNLTLDLGGKTVTLAVSDESTENVGAFVLANADAAYTVTVKNGKITGSVTGKNDKSNAFSLNQNAALALDGVVMDVTCKRGIQIRDYSQNAKISVKNSTLEVKEGKDGVYVIATNAAVKNNDTSKGITIDISGSTLETTSVANDSCGSTGLLLNVPGTYTITNSKIKGERQAAIFRGGTYTVSGSTFEYTTNHTHNSDCETKGWDTGNDVPNAAIVIGNKTKSEYAYPTTVTFKETNTLTVPESGGYQLYVYQYDGTDARKVKVSGNDDSWTVNSDRNGADYPTAKIGSTTYSTLQAAINAASVGETITVLTGEQIDNSSNKITVNKKVTIVGENGATFTYGDLTSNDGAFVVTADGVELENLTFKATVDSNELAYAVVAVNGNECIVKDCKFLNNKTKYTALVVAKEMKHKVSGCEFDGGFRQLQSWAIVGGGTVIKDCTFKNSRAYNINFQNGDNNTADITIEECKFSGWNSYAGVVPTFKNCVFTKDTYGLINAYTSTTFNNCSFSKDFGVYVAKNAMSGSKVTFTFKSCKTTDGTEITASNIKNCLTIDTSIDTGSLGGAPWYGTNTCQVNGSYVSNT